MATKYMLLTQTDWERIRAVIDGHMDEDARRELGSLGHTVIPVSISGSGAKAGEHVAMAADEWTAFKAFVADRAPETLARLKALNATVQPLDVEGGSLRDVAVGEAIRIVDAAAPAPGPR